MTDRGSDGRPGSFEELVAARSAALYRTAYLLTGHAGDAEDLVQTTLEKLWGAWRKVARADSPDAYARRVMMNAFLSGRRRPGVRRERLVESPPDLPAPTGTSADDRLTLWPAVLALPERQRAVVVLRFYGQLTEAEIAEALGMARGTVKSTSSAALRNLRSALEQQEGER
ncbi:SigE family RNA polymerase sigma factor [Nocardioides bruguierae]|uniref:SigE family RNA polymerase sigma factor n=1 Tax=Nocardioides bruguierae TaxID=2945102 RepID=A0A9X2DAJ8_9ACTN|nr:SigE family RNA polymerase sigma factor [Nocardioides bruguierae]MCL8026808.1 SigE family RNA polymerase sigma factor [Nocardioides bruguierae]MCM0621074.1 SigE family RNA polymerase sigma factor [Nocardioides bruguierae]